MKRLLLLLITILSTSVVYSQTYNIQTETGNTISTCSGSLYDSGGAAGDYAASESFQVTICPDTPGDLISIDLAFFELQAPTGAGCSDWMEVFNGTGTAGASLSAGALCGTLTGLSFTSSAVDGCLTITFDSNNSQQFPGFEAIISCVTPCETPTAALVDATDVIFCSPTADNSTSPYTVNVDGSPSTVGAYDPSQTHAIDEYIWDWGDGTTSSTTTPTTSHDYSTTGVYTVTLVVNDDNTDNSTAGCSSTNAVTKTVYVAPGPDIQTTGGTVNCGDCIDIEAIATSQTEAEEPPIVVAPTTALPDGGGVCYSSSVDYTGLFLNGATMTAGCYPEVCLDLDHSFTGDLVISLIAPTGETVLLFNKSFAGANFGDCTPPADDGVAGCPRTYCFVPIGGTLLTDAVGDNGADCGPCDASAEAGLYVVADNFAPEGDFADLNGADLNGSWTLEVCDEATLDDGTLHGWSINFPSTCYRTLNEITPDLSTVTWTPDGTENSFTDSQINTAVFAPGPDACPDGETCEGNQITSTPTVCFDNPTNNETYMYNFLVTDQYGCEFRDSVGITVSCNCTAVADLTVSGPTEICSGDASELTFNISSGVGPTYDLVYTDGTTNFTINDVASGVTTVPVSPSVTTTYTLVTVYDDGAACFGAVSGSGTITVYQTPNVNPLANQVVCDSYTLPTITGTNLSGNQAYYTGTGGTGTQYLQGDFWTTAGTTTLYIYDETGTTPNCFDQETFDVTVNLTPVIDPLANQSACDSISLPVITGTNLSGNQAYYTGAGATGTQYTAGDFWTTVGTTTLYIYDSTATSPACFNQETFDVTIISSPIIDPLTNQAACDSLALPTITGANLSGNQAYYTGIGGTGTMLAAGDYWTTVGTTTLYIYDETVTAPSCSDEVSFDVTIYASPIIDPLANQAACDSYTFPTITGTNLTGNEAYYTGTGGTGTQYLPSNIWTTVGTTTLYIYDETATAPSCSDEVSFDVTIYASPDIDPLANQTACDSYTFPTITGTNLTGNEAYYTGTGGTGTQYLPGNTWTTVGTTTIYIYDATGTTPICTDEEVFDVTINQTPSIDPLVNQTECDSYILPAITGVNLTGNEAYYTGTGGTGTMIPAGNSWTTVGTTTLYIYDETGTTPNCFDEVSFDVTINASPNYTLSSTDPSACGVADGTITFSGLDPNTTYDITYTDASGVVGPLSIATDALGDAVISGLSAGSYTDFIVTLNGCSTSDASSVTLTDPNAPAVNAGQDQQVCDGSPVTLTADNPDGATISWNNGVVDGVAFTPVVGTLSYTVTADIGGCTNTDQVIVTVVPTIDALNCPGDLTASCNITEQPAYADFDAFIAAGGSVTLAPGGAVDSTSFALANVTTNGTCPETVTRTYQITDTCGVTVTCTQDIVIHDLVDPTASNPAPEVVNCDTDVPAPDVAVVTDAADNCTAAPTVTHIGDVSDGNTCDGEIITRTYRIEDDCGNFTDVEQIITIDAYNPTFTVAGTDPTTCQGTDGFITVSGLDPNTDYTIEYNGGATTTITTDAAGEYIITGLTAGDYIGFTIANADCPTCSTTDGSTITLTDPTPPSVDAGIDQEVCEGEGVTLTADNPDGATITWDNGVTNGVAFTPGVGNVTYTVTAELNGCISTDSVDVNVVINPIAEFTANPSTGSAPLNVDFTDNSTNGIDYIWDFGNGETSASINPSTVYSQPGTYQVVLTVTNGICSDQASITIVAEKQPLIYTIPNIITPNGDGSNDVLQMNINNAESVEIEIFNRWGNLVGTVNSLDPEKGWDGTDHKSGKPVSDGVYFYTYKITSIYGEVIEGHQYIHVNSGKE